MQTRPHIAALAAVAAAAMPVAATAQDAAPVRASAAASGNDLGGRSRAGVPFIGILVAIAIIVGIVIIADDDDNDPVSP